LNNNPENNPRVENNSVDNQTNEELEENRFRRINNEITIDDISTEIECDSGINESVDDKKDGKKRQIKARKDLR
jgi:hypothetical protein